MTVFAVFRVFIDRSANMSQFTNVEVTRSTNIVYVFYDKHPDFQYWPTLAVRKIVVMYLWIDWWGGGLSAREL